jgi:hypothetical protein
MTYSYNLNIYGFVFVFHVPSDEGAATSSEHGIVINPSVDIENADFPEALSIARECYEYVCLIPIIAHWRHIWNTSNQYVNNVPIQMIEKFRKGNLPVPEWMEQFYQDLQTGNRPEIEPARLSAKEKRLRNGYVYLLKSDTGHYKIGRTIDPENRQKTFGVQLPFNVQFECLIKSDDNHKLEKSLHERFEHRRVRGEWFDLTDDDVEYIKGLAE